MSDKRRNDKYDAYNALQKDGIDVQKHNQIRPNAGSETFIHNFAKLCVGFIGLHNSYWVSSEVDLDNNKQVDVLLWGNPDRLTYAVECETGWTDDTKTKKVNQYVKPYSEIDDMLSVEVLDIPAEVLPALENVSEQIGLEL